MTSASADNSAMDETFIWTLDRNIDGTYDLSLYTINAAQFAIAPRRMYTSLKPFRNSSAKIKLFIRVSCTVNAILFCLDFRYLE